MNDTNQQLSITIDGKTYPCRQTMGAMIRFKRETGREVDSIGSDISDMAVYLWCCVVSASNHDGVAFDLSLMDFADSMTPGYIERWASSGQGQETGGDAEKKR